MHKYLVLISMMLISFSSSGQGYNTAIGVRLGNDLGFTLQQRVANKTTVEAMFYGGRSTPETFANIMGQQHLPLLSKKFNGYVGVGFGSHWQYVDDVFTEQKYTIPAVIGVEASFGRLNLSGDVMPHLILNNGNEKSYKSIANVSLRLIVIKRKNKTGDKIKDKLDETFPERNKRKKNLKKNAKKKKKKLGKS